MQTLRKPLEKCLIGACPAFPFDLADQPVSSAASSGKGAQAAAAGGIDSEGGTLVHLNCTPHAQANIHAHSLAITITFIRTLRFLRSHSPPLLQLPPVPFVEGARFLDIRIIKAGFKEPQLFKYHHAYRLPPFLRLTRSHYFRNPTIMVSIRNAHGALLEPQQARASCTPARAHTRDGCRTGVAVLRSDTGSVHRVGPNSIRANAHRQAATGAARSPPAPPPASSPCFSSSIIPLLLLLHHAIT